VVASGPALAVGEVTKDNFIELVATGQPVLPTAVRVRFTDPKDLSAIVNAYVGVSVVPLVKVPVPDVVHDRLAKFVAEAPEIVKLLPEEHALLSLPALAVASLFMVNVIEFDADAQGAFPVAVSVNVAVPVEISFVPGVYSGFKDVELLKVPSPDDVHERVE
jgi:hypothetical protein